MFQDLKLFPKLSLIDNLRLKNNLTNHKTENELLAWIELVSLSHKKDSLVGSISLGQRQRVAILRALCQPFDYLLLDEPFSHLDEENIKIVTTLIDKELKTQNAGLIMTSLGSNYFFEYDYILHL